MSRLSILGIGWIILPSVLPGCVIPTYHQPQGFSSTYYQELQKVAAIPPAPVVGPVMASAARVGGPQDLLPVPKPIESADAPQELNEEPPSAGSVSWWSWIRSPLTFRSTPPADSSADEDENDADDGPVRR